MKMNGDTENKTEELIKALELHIRETMPETCSSWQLFINCQGWEVEAINRSPEVLARDGISMRNLRVALSAVFGGWPTTRKGRHA